MCFRDAERGAQLSRTGKEPRIDSRMARGPEQNGMRHSLAARHDVCAEVEPVNLENVKQAAVPVHRLHARRASPTAGMGSRVPLPEIRFDLDEPSSINPPAETSHDPAAQQPSRDGAGIAPKEFAAGGARRKIGRVEEEGRKRPLAMQGPQLPRSAGAPESGSIPGGEPGSSDRPPRAGRA